jgi:DNA-binding transcriptional MerR regulator
MRIGELARLSGTRPATLRYYESRGLIVRPERTVGGYRDYAPGSVAQLRLIRWAQGLGFTLREIREMTGPVAQHAAGRGPQVRDRVRAKIAELDARMSQLARIRSELEALASCPCTGDCPVIADVRAGAQSSHAPRRR